MTDFKCRINPQRGSQKPTTDSRVSSWHFLNVAYNFGANIEGVRQFKKSFKTNV